MRIGSLEVFSLWGISTTRLH